MSGVPIAAAIAVLGGPAPRGNRFPAWERGSTDRNRSISNDGFYFFDHVTGLGGDAVVLAQWVRSLSTGEALAFLETEGLRPASRPMTRTEKRRAERAALERKQRAQDVEDFRRALTLRLDVEKLEAVQARDFDELERAATLQFRLSEKPGAIYDSMRVEQPLQVSELVAWGREDRQHAAELTATIIGWMGGAI